jgi:hypothetical protein
MNNAWRWRWHNCDLPMTSPGTDVATRIYVADASMGHIYGPVRRITWIDTDICYQSKGSSPILMNGFQLNLVQSSTVTTAEWNHICSIRATKSLRGMKHKFNFITDQKKIVNIFYMVCILCNEVITLKLSLCLTKHYAMKTYGGVDV